MSFEPYHFHMVLRMERMTRADRLAADEQAGRMAFGAWRLGRAVLRGARGVRRVLLGPSGHGAAMRSRRNP
jgi:hypothetical protein